MTARVSERAAEMTERLSEQAHHLGERASETGYRMRRRVEDMVEERPLAVGVLGAALGAAVAAMLPGTRTEDELMGASSDRAKRQAREAAEEQAHKVTAAAKSAAEAATEAMREELEGDGSRPHAGDGNHSRSARHGNPGESGASTVSPKRGGRATHSLDPSIT